MTNKEKYLKSKQLAEASKVEGWFEKVQREARGGLVITQLYSQPVSKIAIGKAKSVARAYADVGRF